MRLLVPFTPDLFARLQQDDWANPAHQIEEPADGYSFYAPEAILGGQLPYTAIGDGRVVERTDPDLRLERDVSHIPNLVVQLVDGLLVGYSHVVPRLDVGSTVSRGDIVAEQNLRAPSALLGGEGPRYWHMHLSLGRGDGGDWTPERVRLHPPDLSDELT